MNLGLPFFDFDHLLLLHFFWLLPVELNATFIQSNEFPHFNPQSQQMWQIQSLLSQRKFD